MKKNSETIFQGITLVLFIIVFGASIYGFQVGSHNVDLGQNMRYLECELDTSFRDMANDFQYYSASELYIEGQNQMTRSFYLGMFSAFGIGYCIFILVNKKRELNYVQYK